ncbi:MAG: GH25 family lysozyme [[Ruminococcus] lactaris]|uniref:GH25 family lysozyme n=1 Tax=[Ruminococcus] lactaris TaxID=46228 RepID=UPI00399FC74A
MRRTRSLCGATCRLCWTGLRNIIINLPFSILQKMYETYLKGHFDEYPLWIRNVVTKPDSQADWCFWQYTNRGRLNGYAGEETFIDLNVFYGDIESWNRWRH